MSSTCLESLLVGERPDCTLDDAQYGLGQGPCLHAFRTGRAVLLDLDDDDPRWPDFKVAAVTAGARTALSVPLRLDDDAIGSLNFYSRTRGAFSADAARQAQLFARPSALRLSYLGVVVHAAEATEVIGPELQDRDTIEQALGVLMGVHRDGSVERARRRLQHTAAELGVGLPQAAARLVDAARMRAA